MKLPALSGYALWLLPAPSSGKIVRQQIAKLSNTYHSLSFEPHVTIGAAPDWDEVKLKKVPARISSAANPFKIKTKRVDCGEEPYQKITIKTDDPGELYQFADAIDMQFSGSFGKRSNFHLSLLYSTLSCDELHEEVNSLQKMIPAEIELNSIALVKLNGLPDSWEIVEVAEFQKLSDLNL